MYRNLAYLAAWGSLLLPACTDTNTDTESTTDQAVTSRGDSTTVSLAMARAVAETYQLPLVRHVASSSVKLDSTGRPAMYGFNFVEGGWVIVGGDYEYEPILAYNDAGTIDVTASFDGFSLWKASTTGLIEAIRGRSAADSTERKAKIAEAREMREGWVGMTGDVSSRADVDRAEVTRAQAIANILCDDDVCSPTHPQPCKIIGHEIRGPLMTSFWGQGCAYNQLMPPDPIGSLYCDRMPAGCGPIAMGQVMRYHGYNRPNAWLTFDWSSMPNGPVGNLDERAVMIQWLGTIAGADYEHTGTGTILPNELATLEFFGYTPTVVDYSSPYDVVHDEVYLGRPVLVSGVTAENNSHLWVADGSKRNLLEEDHCIAQHDEKTRRVNYNWGHDGHGNGWFTELNFDGYNSNLYAVRVVKP